MSYRGDDLDLRTPQVAPGDLSVSQSTDPFVVAHRARSSTNAAHGAPIWVDETVLDCCNHAFDVASAHRAGEVRLEHLIYAMTRIADAADALEARGVPVAALRREAATHIATEIPALPGNGKSVPRRADAFEEALRLAAARAYRRQSPVIASDVVDVLFDSAIEFTNLARFLPGSPPRHVTFSDAMDADISRDLGARPLNAGASGQIQSSRIDTIEQSIRILTTELTNERKILSGVLQDLQRELMAQRDDTSRLGGFVHDKFQTVYGDRLQSLEQPFLGGRGAATADLGGLQDRLALLERALQGEISVTRSAVEALAARPPVDIAPLDHRLNGIERAAAADREIASAQLQKLIADLETVSATLELQPAEISNPLIEHLNALSLTRDAHHAATTDSLSEALRRLAEIEESLKAYLAKAEDAERLAAEERAGLREDITRVSETLAQEASAAGEAFTKLTENLTQDITELEDGITKIGANQHTLAGTLDVQAQAAANSFAVLMARIEELERSAAKPVEMLHALSTTVERMHKVTVEKYYRRNRFWYWLFGTDDWLAASWPSQSARIAEELRSIRG